MLTVLMIILVVLVVVMGGLVAWFIASQSTAVRLLQQQLEALKASQDNVSQVVEKTLRSGQETVSQNLQSNLKTLSELHHQIGILQGTNQQMVQIGMDVRRLGDILKSPKMRGQMGERSLENLLSMVLPKGSFELQSRFKDGRVVDALIKMPEYSVAVDAKFPLPSFEAMIKTENDGERAKLRRQFQKDVMTHIDKIASSYIRPAEGTLDFAMMYIPAENVYYETIIKTDDDTQDIQQYSLEKKVVPVSPNLLYAYLMTIAMGLNGLQIEKQAAEIRANLTRLNGSFAEFTASWDVLGNHIKNVYNKYEEGNKKLDKFGFELTAVQAEEKDRAI